MKLNLSIKPWTMGKTTTSSQHTLVFDGSDWWLAGNNPEVELGHITHYIEGLPDLPDLVESDLEVPHEWE